MKHIAIFVILKNLIFAALQVCFTYAPIMLIERKLPESRVSLTSLLSSQNLDNSVKWGDESPIQHGTYLKDSIVNPGKSREIPGQTEACGPLHSFTDLARQPNGNLSWISYFRNNNFIGKPSILLTMKDFYGY